MLMSIEKESIIIKRSTAVALLVRLEMSDIPYVLSKKDREILSTYLSNIIMNNTDDAYDAYETTLIIDINDLKEHVTECDDIVKILQNYAMS